MLRETPALPLVPGPICLGLAEASQAESPLALPGEPKQKAGQLALTGFFTSLHRPEAERYSGIRT
jgi:hypothetical protein